MPFRRYSRLRTSLVVLVGVLYCGASYAQSARQLAEQGISLNNQRRYEDAVRKFEQAHAKAPEVTRILILLGNSHLQLGHLEEAMGWYERFEQAERAPDNDEQALLLDGYEEGARKLEQEFDRTPQRPELLLFAGRARFRLKQMELASSLYQRYLQAAPSPAEPQRQLRDRYLREYHEEALRVLPAQSGRENERPELLLLLADSYLALAQDEAALDALDHYREDKRTKSAEGTSRLASAYQSLLTRWASATGVSVLLRGRAHFGLNLLQPASEDYTRYRAENPAPPAPTIERQTRYESELQASVARAQEEVERRAAEQREAERRQTEETARLARQEQAASQLRAVAAQRRAQRWMLWTGAAGIGLGVGLISLGIAGFAYDGRCIDATQPCNSVYDSFNVGLGTTIAGSAFLAGGASLLAVGIYKQKKH